MGRLNIAVFGLGFVGLTTALGFADKGFSVRGFDINESRRVEISRGKLPFFEPGLDGALARNLGKTFAATDTAEEAAKTSDVCFFCVGTPANADGSADLTHLLSAMDGALAVTAETCVLVVKSTVPPGTLAKRVEPYIREKGRGNPVAANPEFLREGYCWEDFVNPDRIVCGVTDKAARELLSRLYESFGAPVRFVSPSTAEFIKYLSNTLLATLISYSNEMSLIANAVGDIEIANAFHILHEDKRLAGAGIDAYIYPGCGYGGYCLPKDTLALKAVSQANGVKPRSLGEVIALNNKMPEHTAQRIIDAAENNDAKIGILGLSFKPGSDDVRDSSAAKIIKILKEKGYGNIYGYDPLAIDEFRRVYGTDITCCSSANELCGTCDVVAVVTAWEEFKGLDKAFPNVKWVDCRYFL
ncbi:MAG: nucleotide sugar dehydrogenase [Oscillospiraceae bacterium]|nr:nucleotide sugar dehydrogenase [Oscillospiraceae bacterium]